MHIYFCGSIRGGRQDVGIYQRIVQKLQTYGKVLTEHVSHSDISEKGEPRVLSSICLVFDRGCLTWRGVLGLTATDKWMNILILPYTRSVGQSQCWHHTWLYKQHMYNNNMKLFMIIVS